MKKLKITQIIQGPLVVVTTGITLGFLFVDTDLAISNDHMVTLPVADSFSSFIGQFSFPDFSALLNPKVYVIAFTIAIVGSLETLLSVEAIDNLDPEKRVTPTNRELIAQGVGNTLSGLVGGLPITQVIVRSSANVQSGGKTKTSAFIHGILLLVTVAFIPQLLNMIPLACLAAILLVVGFKLAKPSAFKKIYKQGSMQFIPFITTVLAIVFTDLLVGICIGLAVATFYILYFNFKISYQLHTVIENGKQTVHVKLAETVSFLNKANILKTLHAIPEHTHLVIDASHTKYMHFDVEEIINDFMIASQFRDIDVKLIGFPVINEQATKMKTADHIGKIKDAVS